MTTIAEETPAPWVAAAAAATVHRLVGLESDNLLAFLALLGLLRALEAADRDRAADLRWLPRLSWSFGRPPLRPLLHLHRPATANRVAQAAAAGVVALSADHDFSGRTDLNHSWAEARAQLVAEAATATSRARGRVDLLSAIMSDGAVKEARDATAAPIDPTPLCLLLGQGHQHFLSRLAGVPAETSPPPRGRGRAAVTLSAADCIAESLFASWHRADPTFSFRWDPDEDVRYALMAGDPTNPAYKSGTQHGANRLAAVGLAALTLVPETRAGRVRPTIVGGESGAGDFSFAWPLWREPASLSAIRAMLAHPDLRVPGALARLGIEDVLVARRIWVGRFMNFTRARPLPVTRDRNPLR